jgi:tetratricopeptide (TPR) repeat protein
MARTRLSNSFALALADSSDWPEGSFGHCGGVEPFARAGTRVAAAQRCDSSVINAAFSSRIALLSCLLLFISVQQAAAQQKTDAAGGQDQGASAAEAPAEVPERLLDRSPFDRITLNAANGNAVIDTVLLDLPDRKLPNPLPKTGSLSLRRLSHPSIPYSIEWSAIEKIELYEHLLLAEANRLTAAGNFAEAFEYLAFLASNYPHLEGLESSMQNHLWREAGAAFSSGKYQEAWSVLQALYGRNPQYPRLANAVQAVSDDRIAADLKQANYDAARKTVDALEQAFPELKLQNIAQWRARFQQDAQSQIAKARTALAAKRFREAREAVNFARSILPSIEGGEALWIQIQQTAPEIRVGVTQPGRAPPVGRTPDWASARVAELVEPRLVHMVDFGADGGVYRCRLGELRNSADGLSTTLQLSPAALAHGVTPDAVALQLIDMASPDSAQFEDDLGAVLDNVSVAEGREVVLKWRRPYLRPGALLKVSLPRLVGEKQSAGLWYHDLPTDKNSDERAFELTASADGSSGNSRTIVEQQFKDDEAQIDALVRGDVDVIDRVPPWQLARLKSAPGIVVAAYRLPTVHVLVPNLENRLIETREFRRALCYGIDATNIIRDILLAGQDMPGYRPLSGPFPAGSSLTDPAGYAYNNDIQVRPYEPRLASLLSLVARTTLAKQDAERKKAEVAEKQKAEPSGQSGADSKSADSKPADGESAKAQGGAQDLDELPKLQPLVLAHASDAVARLACQSIKLQLDQTGIPIKLVEYEGSEPPAGLKYDLLYAELAVREPIADARGLLGRQGVAPRCSPLMALALDELPFAENWNQARARLNDIHRIAHYDLPLIPLWQTVNYFAYRKNMSGIGDSPVTLYQNISDWQKSFQ